MTTTISQLEQQLNVDAIFVISLHKDELRRKFMRSWYRDFPLRFFLVHPKKNREYGCYDSHRKVIYEAKQKGYKQILVLEDDAFPRFNSNFIVQLTNQSLQVLNTYDPNWKLLMLGYIPFRTRKTKFDYLLTVQCCVDAHAYIVNVNNITIPEYDGIPIDVHLFCNSNQNLLVGNLLGSPIIYNRKQQQFDKLQNFGVYATNPMLMTQRNISGQSNIDNAHLLQSKFIELYENEDRLTELSTKVNTVNLGIFILAITIMVIIGLGLFIAWIFGQKNCGYFSIVSFLIIIILIIVFTTTSL